ncbi:MAG: hypothetical protein V1845_01800 [bacterium]
MIQDERRAGMGNKLKSNEVEEAIRKIVATKEGLFFSAGEEYEIGTRKDALLQGVMIEDGGGELTNGLFFVWKGEDGQAKAQELGRSLNLQVLSYEERNGVLFIRFSENGNKKERPILLSVFGLEPAQT